MEFNGAKYMRRPSGELLEEVGRDEMEALADHWLHSVSDLTDAQFSWFQDWRSVHLFRRTDVNGRAKLLHDKIRRDFLDAWKPGTVYRSVYPALRFRYNLIPSYGAMVSNRMEVATTTCYNSECLLLCEDIAQLLYTQEKRTAVILLNPNVPVYYTLEQFQDTVPHSSSKLDNMWKTVVQRALVYYPYYRNGYIYTAWTRRSVIPLSADIPSRYSVSRTISPLDDWQLSSQDPFFTDVTPVYAPLRQEWVWVDLTLHFMMLCDYEIYEGDFEYSYRLVFCQYALIFSFPALIFWKMVTCWRKRTAYKKDRMFQV